MAQHITTDTDAVDAIATYLGTSPEWSGADALDTIADVLGSVRPSVGMDPAEFRRAFRAATGRAVPASFDMAEDEDETSAHDVDAVTLPEDEPTAEELHTMADVFRAEGEHVTGDITDATYSATYARAERVFGAPFVEVLSHPDMPGLRANGDEMVSMSANMDTMRELIIRARAIVRDGDA